MVSFASDYITGAHPDILQKFIDTNLMQEAGYGSDQFTISAIDKIRKECECEDAQVYLCVGGTQTNQLVISTMLKEYEGVVAAVTGHISLHEAGAIEYSGNKVITIPGHMGKIDAAELEAYFTEFEADDNKDFMVYPGMVYISQPTEYGSLYSLAELENISEICHQHGASLFIDGARLGMGLMSAENDATLPDIARLSDVFYIGGTKMGALCGEAIVFTKNNMPAHFANIAKKRGALVAKGRLLGVQFDALFTDDLYYKIGAHAIEMKDKMNALLKAAGYKFFYESPTNQQFVVLENSELERIQKDVVVSFWEKYDDNHTVVRFATGWSTSDEDLEELKKVLEK